MFSPGYYSRFQCIASDCPDSCCRSGWEIPIDDKTYEYYLTAGIPELADNVAAGSDGDRVFKLKSDGCCPYLDENGLCRLYTCTGGVLCDICDKYPRFFEEYDGFTEAGISVSCPEARRLVLSASSSDYSLYGEAPAEELLAFLHSGRRAAFKLIFESKTADIAADELERLGARLQELIDFGELTGLEDALGDALVGDDQDYTSANLELSDFCKIILERTEILYPRWKHELEDFIRCGGSSCKSPESEKRSYLAYLVYRFFLKAVSTEDIYSVCGLIAAAYRLCASLGCGLSEAAGLFSKEIEHDTENTEALLGWFSEKQFSENYF